MLVRKQTLLMLLVIGWVVAAPAVAGVCEYPPEVLSPPGGGDAGATPVEVGILMLDLIKIDDVGQGFVADVFVRAIWRDPRLANANDTNCVVPSSAIWTPRVEIVNQRELTPKWADSVRITSDGEVLYRQRYYGTLSFNIDLTDFPFDRQVIPITAVVGESTENLSITADRVTGRSEDLSIPNWEIGTASSRLGKFSVRGTGIELPLFVVEFPAERRAMYYVFKTIVPLVLIVCMSWAVFWIHPKNIPPRLGLAATGMLTLIAFQLALGSALPPVAYLTRLDRFVAGATVIVFTALLEAVTTAALADSGRVSIAERINRWSRFIFPLGLVLSALIAFA